MDFYAILDQVVALLRQRQRVTYRALKRQFALDDDALADLTAELLYAYPQVRDDAGQGLLWTDDPGPAPASVEPPQPAPLADTPSYLTEKILTSRSALEGERKQVTVLFADLKGSMELLADRDPEEARQLLDPVLERMMTAVHRYEGTVNQVMGDGIMALFGAPLAHEDHAVRACYAALAMQAAVKQYATEVQRRHGVPVQIRVGLHAGEVVVRAIGNDLYMDYSAIGQTTHLAARMEQMAMPGTILLTPAVVDLANGFIHVTSLGPVPIKGLDAPLEVFELVGATALRRRLQTAVARGLSPLVGRQPELEALQQALVRAGAGQGQVVALLGEPGVGKSRLVYELLHAPHTQGWLRLESGAVSYGKATAYLPVCDLLKAYWQIEDRDTLRIVQAKVTGQLLTLDATLQDAIPAILTLFEALPTDSPFLHLDPVQRRRRTQEALKRVLLRESQVQPLLLVFEDLHWIDSETQAMLDMLVESLPTARVLLLVTYRPEYQHGWGSKTYYTQLRLDPLPEASADTLLQVLVGADAGLTPLTRLLIARTQGNPFFLEESVRTLVEIGGLVGDRGAYHLAQPLDTLQVPATVQALLAARIDRLPPEDKRLLQTAAVIGTEVPGPLLQAIADTADAALYHSLAQLQAAEFLYETSLFPERAYTFKHALTHEVAYGSLLHERRRTLHAQVMEALEALGGDRLIDHVDRLAHHAVRGEVWDKALGYFQQAGEKAEVRSAYREAVACHEGALDALQRLPASRQTRELAIDLRFKLRRVLTPLGEFARGFAYLREAATLAEDLDDHPRLGWASAFMAFYFTLMGDQDRAMTASQRVLAIAAAHDMAALQDEATTHLGQAYYTRGEYRHALDLLRPSVARLQGDWLRERLRAGSQVPVFARTVLVLCLAEVGAFHEGHARGDEGVQIAEAAQHAFSRILAYWGGGLLALGQGDLRHATPLLERGLALCQAANLPALLPIFVSALSYAYVLAGRHPEALEVLDQAMATMAPLQERALAFHALVNVWLGHACLLTGRIDEAYALASQAHELAQVHRGRGHAAWALHLLGDIAMHHQPPEIEPAATHYHQALALAEALGMRPLQAHCYRGLGTLYATTGQWEQARTALSTAIEMYQSMEMTFWLPQTEAALVQVAAR
jgi:class 3 adenylate cyclase/tetratricopeptide (TPR) repeat protein